ncbi:MAG: tryptophan--tRNA ligase [Candidatus Falkowbacteria bacterium]|nr:tryptophan--tRNA ligase [Candidatus Falkowbacteria bacterium]
MDKTNQKKRVFSGIQPSGNLHIGNYIGAITQWIEMQKNYQCIFCVVDYHAITIRQDPKVLKEKIKKVAKIYLASGIDPGKSIIFQQSDVSEHTELAWILNTVARMSDLYRMTQFKDKSSIDIDHLELLIKTAANQSFFEDLIKEKREIIEAIIKREKDNAKDTRERIVTRIAANRSLQELPKIMYKVPVGEDQAQHVELCRTLAKRFNSQFGETFKIPEVVIRKEGARIMGLDDPTKKMSKSAQSEYNYLALLDDPNKAAKKIMRAETDSGSEIKYDVKNKPGISNLLVIYSFLAKEAIKSLENKYKGKGYGDFKKDLAELVKNFLTKFQADYNKISDEDVQKILNEGRGKVAPIAAETLEKVKNKIGIK